MNSRYRFWFYLVGHRLMAGPLRSMAKNLVFQSCRRISPNPVFGYECFSAPWPVRTRKRSGEPQESSDFSPSAARLSVNAASPRPVQMQYSGYAAPGRFAAP
jgi:hypothetical protein